MLYKVHTLATFPGSWKEKFSRKQQRQEEEQEQEIGDNSGESYIRLDLEGEIRFDSSNFRNSEASSDRSDSEERN